VSVPTQLIIDEAVRFERNLSSLYLQFLEAFPEDEDFWWELSIDEQRHASSLETGQKLFHDEFAREVVIADLDGLRQSNEDLESTIQRLGKEPLDRAEAFQIALRFECDENEATLFELLEIGPSDPASTLVDSLHREDLVHQQKIRDYAASAGITITPDC
jgi:hypothetical protein